MNEMMKFPKIWEDFLHDYEFEDARRIYANGSKLIPSLRVKQMISHYFPSADVAPVQKWISVKDRLPENEQDVIICAERRHYSNPNRFIRIVAKAFYTDGKHDTEHTAYVWNNDYIDMEYDDENDAFLIPEGWWESIEYGEEFSAVSDFATHWMPIPEPPKEE